MIVKHLILSTSLFSLMNPGCTVSKKAESIDSLNSDHSKEETRAWRSADIAAGDDMGHPVGQNPSADAAVGAESPPGSGGGLGSGGSLGSDGVARLRDVTGSGGNIGSGGTGSGGVPGSGGRVVVSDAPDER